MQIVECFKILNVSPGEDWQKVRKSYHSLAKQFHPDIHPGKRSDDTRLKEINQAFEYLETHYKASRNILPEQLESFDQKRNPDKWGSLFDGLRDNPAVQRVFRSGLIFLVELDTKVFQLDIQKNIKISESILQKGGSLHLKLSEDCTRSKLNLHIYSQWCMFSKTHSADITKDTRSLLTMKNFWG